MVMRRPVSRSRDMVLPEDPTPVSTTWPRPMVDPPPVPVPMTVPVIGTPGWGTTSASRRTRASHNDEPVGVVTRP